MYFIFIIDTGGKDERKPNVVREIIPHMDIFNSSSSSSSSDDDEDFLKKRSENLERALNRKILPKNEKLNTVVPSAEETVAISGKGGLGQSSKK